MLIIKETKTSVTRKCLYALTWMNKVPEYYLGELVHLPHCMIVDVMIHSNDPNSRLALVF